MQPNLERASESVWRSLYLAALFEADPTKMPGRIAEAEHGLNLRERELWYSGGSHTQERLALIGARRALEALGIIHQGAGRISSPLATTVQQASLPLATLAEDGRVGPNHG
jgi:hypothetical protein